MCGGAWLGPGVPGDTVMRAMARGWALAIPIWGAGRAVGSTRYTTLPVLPRVYPPGTHLAPPTCRYRARTRCAGPLEHAHMTVSGAPKEILGVANAPVGTGNGQGTLRLCRTLSATLRLSSPAPPCAPTPAYLRLISVYLSISQDTLVLRIR